MDLRLPWLQNARNGGRPGAHNIGQNGVFIRGRRNIPIQGQEGDNGQERHVAGEHNAQNNDEVSPQMGVNLTKILDGEL